MPVRYRGWLSMLLVAAWCVSVGVGARVASADATMIDSLHAAVKTHIEAGERDRAVADAERAVKLDPGQADSHFLLGKALALGESAFYRKEAERAFEAAITLDSLNVVYRLALAELTWEQGFWYNSIARFKGIIEKNPSDSITVSTAAFWIGYYALKTYGEVQDKWIVGNDAFADEELNTALRFLERSVALNPGDLRATRQLALVYLISRSPRKVLEVGRLAARFYPDDPRPYLIIGLGYHAAEMYPRAVENFSLALGCMRPSERDAFEALAFAEYEEMQAAHDPQAQGEGFWESRDPLLLTDFNERRLELLRRVAYSDLRFGRIFRDEIRGWQTDMGKTYVKFGDYLTRVLTGGTLGTAQTQTWYFEDFDIRFRNVDGLDDWRFEGKFWFEALEDMRNGRWPEHGRDILEKRSPRVKDPLQDRKHAMPHQLVEFPGPDSVRFEAYVAMPDSLLHTGRDGRAPLVDAGLFALQAGRGIVARDTLRSVRIRRQVSADGMVYHTAALSLTLPRRAYTFRGEMADRIGYGLGEFVAYREPDLKPGIGMSDLLLARRIRELDPDPWRRSHFEITANPVRTYRVTDPVLTYFEIRGLSRDAFGETHYEMSYQLARVDPMSLSPVLFQVTPLSDRPARIEIQQRSSGGFDVYLKQREIPDNSLLFQAGPADLGETRVTAQYRGERDHFATYLNVDVSKLDPGAYRVTLLVRDRVKGDAEPVSASDVFRLVP